MPCDIGGMTLESLKWAPDFDSSQVILLLVSASVFHANRRWRSVSLLHFKTRR
jgi:hypothetical protein